ncbi:MAG: 3-dehydroquinate synthase [Pseudomonadales bacterium]
MSEQARQTDVVQVELGARSYPIYIGRGLLAQGELLRRHIGGRQVAIISNEVVAPLYLGRVRAALGDGFQVDELLLPDGEQHKNLQSFAAVMDFLLERRHNRSTTLIALGGGVVGDLTGFAAATFQRGVDFIQIPTTLLAQVDSSVGGKTAVNHPRGKNMIGAFYQPRCVIADISVFDTLPDREYRAGLAEVLKYGVIRDAAFFDWLEEHATDLGNRNPAAVALAVRRSCEIKAEVVAADEREGGLRAILNFGHTFGHALETLTGYRALLHGEAVAIGMVMAADLSARQGMLPGEDARRLKSLLAVLGLPVAPPAVAASDMLEAMGMDKKVLDGRLRLVLAEAVGRVVVSDRVDTAALRQTLAAGEQLCHV